MKRVVLISLFFNMLLYMLVNSHISHPSYFKILAQRRNLAKLNTSHFPCTSQVKISKCRILSSFLLKQNIKAETSHSLIQQH